MVRERRGDMTCAAGMPEPRPLERRPVGLVEKEDGRGRPGKRHKGVRRDGQNNRGSVAEKSGKNLEGF